MKFSASRSLLHGTVLFGAHAHRLLELPHRRLEFGIAVGEAEAVLVDDADIAALDVEHVEVVQEPAAAVEAAAGRRDRLEPVAAPELVRVHHFAVEEREDERIVLRQDRDHRCADTGLGCGDRVVSLVLAVDREQPCVSPAIRTT